MKSSPRWDGSSPCPCTLSITRVDLSMHWLCHPCLQQHKAHQQLLLGFSVFMKQRRSNCCCPPALWSRTCFGSEMNIVAAHPAAQPLYYWVSSNPLNVPSRASDLISFKLPICTSASSFDTLILNSNSPLLPEKSKSRADFSQHPLRWELMKWNHFTSQLCPHLP